MEKIITSQIGCIVRGYRLEKLVLNEMATQLYHAHTEELWLPPYMLIRLFPLLAPFSERTRAWFLARFEREAHRIVRLRHTSLIPLLGYGMQGNRGYLLTPALQGETLAARLQRQQRWEPARAFSLLTHLAAALDMLHQQGLVHQFLNPEQIFLPHNQPPQIANLRLAQMVCLQGSDLAPEHAADAPAHLQAIDGSYLGAAEYLAPEVVRGLPPDPRSDIYALGVLLFVLLSGQAPFKGSNYLTTALKHLREMPPALHELVPELPVALEIVINRALHPDPQYRYQSAGELAAACTEVLYNRMRTPRFSLLASLQVQHQALPTMEHDQNWQAQPAMSAGLLNEEAQTFPDKDMLPSSHEELVADSWLNTPQASATSSSVPSPELEAEPEPEPDYTTEQIIEPLEAYATAQIVIEPEQNDDDDDDDEQTIRRKPMTQADWAAFKEQAARMFQHSPREQDTEAIAIAERAHETQAFSLPRRDLRQIEASDSASPVRQL